MAKGDIIFFSILGSATLAGVVSLEHGIEDFQAQLNAVNKEKWDYVSSGAGGGVSCNENTNDPITKGKTFEAKQIAGSAELRQLLTIDKATCTVWLLPKSP